MVIIAILIALILAVGLYKFIDKAYDPTVRMDYTPKSGYDDPNRYKK